MDSDLLGVFSCLALLSLIGHAYQYSKRTGLLSRIKNLEDKLREQGPSARELLHHLSRQGSAILKIEVLDPSELYYRSPR